MNRKPGKLKVDVLASSKALAASRRFLERHAKPLPGDAKGDTDNRQLLITLVGQSKLSNAQFSSIIGLAPGTLRQYVKGTRRTPSVVIMAARAGLMMVGVPVLFTGEEIREKLGIHSPNRN